jgi:AcrR family transcriptional regulator
MTAELSTPGSAAPREAILEAALTVLARDGEARFTVRNIAREAGCSTTGVYTWFGGKAGLVDAIFVEGFESFDAALAAAYGRDDLVDAGRRYRRWALANRTHYLVMFGRAVPDVEPGPAALGRGLRSFLDLVDLVRRLRPDLDEQDAFGWAYHVNATVHGYVMTELAGMSTAAPDELDELYELGLHRAAGPLVTPR